MSPSRVSKLRAQFVRRTFAHIHHAAARRSVARTFESDVKVRVTATSTDSIAPKLKT
jgi:hypothetical protein